MKKSTKSIFAVLAILSQAKSMQFTINHESVDNISNENQNLSQFTSQNLIESATQQSYRFLKEPKDHIVRVGLSVTLSCIVSHPNIVVQWTFNNFGLGADRKLPGYERYTVIGSDATGNYSLHISPVLLEDDGFYQCQFLNNLAQKRSRYAKLTVLKEIEDAIECDLDIKQESSIQASYVSVDSNYAEQIAGKYNWIILSAIIIKFLI